MPTLWRISNHADLTGKGGRLYSARWHGAGQPVIYTGNSPAGALVEVLAHMRAVNIPSEILLLRIEAPDEGGIEEVAAESLGPDWTERASLTRQIGNVWLEERRTLCLRVPSAIIPFTSNYLMNPEHPAIEQAVIAATYKIPLDPRLKA